MNVGWQQAKNELRDAGIRVLVFALLAAPVAASAGDNPPPMSFVKVSGTAFAVDGKPFFVTGVNNHYLTFGSRDEVTGVLDDAVAMGANVVRTFLQPTIGSLDGSVATIWNWRNGADASDLGVKGAYLLYWDPRASAMAIKTAQTAWRRLISSSPRPVSAA
jgi:mannan endo-1,4-beta-mannosidase